MKLKKTHINFTRRGSFIWRTVPVCLFLSCTAGSSWPGTCSATTFLVFYLTFKDLSSCRTVYFFAKSRSFKDYTFDLYILMHTSQLNLPVFRNVIFRLGGGVLPLTCFGNNLKSIGRWGCSNCLTFKLTNLGSKRCFYSYCLNPQSLPD